jgi:3-oxoacyl-[acyl-carrier protein] reductase
MIEAGRGSILFVSSISGLEATPTPDLAYATAKAGLLAYAKKLALLHGGHGIRVNALAPGSIEFPGGLWAAAKHQYPAIYDTVRSAIPSGRLGTAEEVADAAVYLVSPRANWITGTTLVVDGGQHRGIR